jgi:MFS family permease
MTQAGADRSQPDLSPWGPLRNKVFFALFVAQIVSNLGSWMQNVGAAWLMGDLGASSAEIAMVQTATFLPVFLVGIPAGALADLFDRRRLLIGTQAAMLLSASAMAAFAFTDSLSPTGLLWLTFVLGTGGALMIPAWQAIQPDLVGREHFAQAVSLGSMSFNVGRAIGPAVGGLIIAAAGAEWVFLINALSFVGTIAVLTRWRPASSDKPGGLPTETFTGAAIAGLRYAIHSPLTHTVLARTALFMLPGTAVLALLPVVVRGQLDWTSGGYGVMLGCFGVGATIGAVLRPRIVQRLHPDAVMAAGSIVFAGTIVVQGYVHSKPVVGLGLAVGGFVWSIITTANTVAAQAALPSWVRARGMSLFMMVQTGSIAVGSALWGVIANSDVGLAHLVAAGVLVVAPVAAVRWPLTIDREIDLTLLPGDSPDVAMTPDAADGPVLVSIAYRVPAESLDEFISVMDYVERHRRRTGGYQWYLFRDLAEPDRFVENFLVSSWAEHLRQHHRKTATAEAQMRRLRPFIEAPGPRHLLSSTSEGALTPHIGQPLRGGDEGDELAELERALERERRLDPSAGENV